MRKTLIILTTGLLAVGLLMTGCSAKQEDPDAAPITVEDTALEDSQMEDSLRALAARMQDQLRANDAEAKVELVVNDDGSCKVAIFSNGIDSDVEEYSSVKNCFASYLEAGFFDSEGNVRGFSDEIPEVDTSAADEEAAQSAALEIIAGTPVQNEDNMAAGFPGEGQINLGTDAESIDISSEVEAESSAESAED